MSVMRSKDGNDIYLDCTCGCDDGIRIRIDKDDFSYYSFLSYTNGNFYRDQSNVLLAIWKKLKKIWSIIINKDFYHNEIVMTKDDFNEFKEYINGIE